MDGDEKDVKEDGAIQTRHMQEQKLVQYPTLPFFRSFKGHRLIKPSKSLYGPACSALEVIGQFNDRLSHGRRSTTQTMHVCRQRPKQIILGLPAIVVLNLVAQVDTTTTASSEIVDIYFKV